MSSKGHEVPGLTIGKARTCLASIWIGGSLPLILIVIAQTTNGRYGNDWETPWGWLATLLFPAWSIIIAVLSAAASKISAKPVHSRGLFYLSFAVSIFYVAALYLIMFVGVASNDGIEVAIKSSSWYMGVFMSFVIGMLGKFFVEDLE